MPVRNRRLILLPEAGRDVQAALHFTRERWGARQRSKYRSLLYDAMRGLIAYPELGPARDDLFPGCRSLPTGQHTVYYRITDAEIVVVRVLHRHQDAGELIRP
ncbi:MAG: hypothetical protein AVDCRST_MAG73-822 [uncultured Thermomicrobiales bacterium]|uniref:Toxin n=1 Tax=uncultured Thermomicrobiales bacterium TaxID=1645740 RepID=A0A6J4TRC6_9BACT|nr:MAG: hypothetical protein AVDCRST_MAG73-822 [uncultured Thermomicrobiales bacterium]